MYLEYQNFVVLGFFLFLALVATIRTRRYKFAFAIAWLGLGALFVPTQFFIDYSKFLFPGG